MAALDVEKRAVLAPPTRRTLPCLALFLGVLVTISIGAISRRCSEKTFLFTGYIGSQADHSHFRLKSQAVNSRSPTAKADETTSVTSSAAASTPTVLKTFEVAQPVLMPDGPAESDGSPRHGKDYSPEQCTVQLMRHDFAWSYDAPFVGTYTPPDCEFNRVVLNFSVVSQGRQFDRLAIMYFGDTEVWRTSTAEPTAPPGISWIYLKDMTEYMYFWKSPQKIIFDLGNLINDKYTGIFNATMTAIFHNADVLTEQAPPSDLIIPISARHGANNSVSRFMLPAENATNTINLPRNIRRAVFSVSANGQAGEEFWWSNVLQNDIYTFNATAGELPGLSPFREVQALIDGQLAGVEWPFPVIFTGGVVPSLHRPIVGIHAFDLREHEIDITPFLPLLCDGKKHTFTIRVAGLNSTGNSTSATPLTDSVNESWYVTGKLFLWLDDDPYSITTGDAPTIVSPRPTIVITRSLTTTPNGTNETLTYTTSVQRTLQITARNLKTQHYSSSSSSSPAASWSQSLRYTNNGHITAFGYAQVNNLLISGNDTAVLVPEMPFSTSTTTTTSPSSSSLRPNASGLSVYRAAYTYPLLCNSSYAVSPQGGNLSISAHLWQGKELTVEGPSVFVTGLEAFFSSRPGDDDGDGEEDGYIAAAGGGWWGRGALASRLETIKEGTAELRQSGDGRESIGWGEARQVFWFGVEASSSSHDHWRVGRREELYYREVEAVNGTVVEDLRRMKGREEEGGSEGWKRTVLADAAALVYA